MMAILGSVALLALQVTCASGIDTCVAGASGCSADSLEADINVNLLQSDYSLRSGVLGTTLTKFTESSTANKAATALADNYNFAAKSVNLPAAYRAEFFKAHHMTAELYPAADAAACTGVELADGSYLLGGNAIESDESTIGEGFATKLNSQGDIVWAWKSGVNGTDGILSVAQLPNGELLAAGYRYIGSTIKRSLTKLNQTTGAEVWSMTDFGDNTAHGLWEMIEVDPTHGVILSGLGEMPGTIVWPGGAKLAFKSGGNTAGGKAVVMTMSIASVSASTAPTNSDVATTKIYADHMIAKTAHFVNANQVAVLLWREGYQNGAATIGVFNLTTGADLFTPVGHSDLIGQGTDMKLVGTTHAVITGHRPDVETDAGYTGRLTKVSLADGQLVWTKEYSSCGFGSNTTAGAPATGQCSKGLIYNECWGVVVLADGGFALSCGTGIEKCYDGPLNADCVAGTGDKRSGAYPQFGGVWASMTVKTDSSGNLDWQRVDSYKCPTCPALPEAPNLPMVTDLYDPAGAQESAITSSAGEWAISINGGTGIAIMTDQQTGIGLQKMVSLSTPPSPSPPPPTPPPPTPPPSPPPCVDNDQGVADLLHESSGIKTCAELAPAGYACDHAEHSSTITALCPATCMCAAPACCAVPAVPAGTLVEKHVSHMDR